MSILNSLIGALTGQDGAANQGGARGGALASLAGMAMKNPQLLAAAAAMFTASNKHGGLEGLLAKFRQNGLGDVADSWVSNGEDKTVSPTQIRDVFGDAGIERIAQKSGTSAQETPDLLASVLPGLVNMLTPDGRAHPQSEAPKTTDDLLGMITGLLKGR